MKKTVRTGAECANLLRTHKDATAFLWIKDGTLSHADWFPVWLDADGDLVQTHPTDPGKTCLPPEIVSGRSRYKVHIPTAAEPLIERSIRHCSVVREEWTGELAIALRLECDGATETTGIVEYWGTDEDANEWRVRLFPQKGEEK